jgi:hypothetical protein
MNTTYILLWMLIVAAFAFMTGWDLGDETRRRRCAEEKIEELRDQLQQAQAPNQQRQLQQMRRVLNDAHRLIHSVSKGLGKRSS